MSTSSTAGEIHWADIEGSAPSRLATELDSVDDIQPQRVFSPQNSDQLSHILRWCNEHRVTVVARGGGTKLQWGNVPHSALAIISLERFTRIVDHPWQDMTVTVEAGVSVATLQSELAKHGQRLPLDVLWPERSTVGGIIATNDSGSLRQRFGSARDLLLGVTVVLADGTIARSGGRVVKNVAGYDLPKLFTGSFGTLGVIAEVTLRTYPLPHGTHDLSFRFPDALAANRFMLAVSDSTLVPAAVQLRASHDELPIVDLRFEGIEAGIEAQRMRGVELAGTALRLDTSADAWRHESYFGDPDAIVAKFSVLPSRISDAITVVESRCSEASIIVQSVGLGFFRAATRELSALFADFHQIGGTLVLLQAPSEMKRRIDVFGPPPSAYPIMVRVKQHFDRNGILSPGRLVGGI